MAGQNNWNIAAASKLRYSTCKEKGSKYRVKEAILKCRRCGLKKRDLQMVTKQMP